MSSPEKATAPDITPIADNYCFVCGKDNPQGLKIQVTYHPEDAAATTELALPREYQGWADVIHGGILATLLDEMMAHAVWHFAGPGLTLSMETRFHHSLKPDEPIPRRGPTQRTIEMTYPKHRQKDRQELYSHAYTPHRTSLVES